MFRSSTLLIKCNCLWRNPRKKLFKHCLIPLVISVPKLWIIQQVFIEFGPGSEDIMESEAAIVSVLSELIIQGPFPPGLWTACRCWPIFPWASELLTLHPRHHICRRSCLDLLLKAVALSDKLSISHRGWREGLNDITGFFYLVTQRQENINFYFCKFIPF